MTGSPDDDYQIIAHFYDSLIEPFLKPIRRDVARIVQSRHLHTILDLCCGTGSQAVLLDRLGFQVTGVDLSPAMLRAARRKSPARIRYYLEDASSTHFADGSFDCVILSLALHEKAPDVRSRIIREARRVLRRAGRILIVDYISPKSLSSRIACGLAHAVERGAGAAHYAHFRQYMQSFALSGLLNNHCLMPFLTRKYYFRTIGLVLAGWPN